MSKIVFGVIVGIAGIWKLMGTFSDEASSKIIIEKTNYQTDQTNAVGMGWIMLTCLVIVGLLILNMKAEQIQHNAEEQAPVFCACRNHLIGYFHSLSQRCLLISLCFLMDFRHITSWCKSIIMVINVSFLIMSFKSKRNIF